MERSSPLPETPEAVAQANERVILSTIARVYGMPVAELRLLPEQTFVSETNDGSLTFMVIHSQGIYALNAFVKPDGSLDRITYALLEGGE